MPCLIIVFELHVRTLFKFLLYFSLSCKSSSPFVTSGFLNASLFCFDRAYQPTLPACVDNLWLLVIFCTAVYFPLFFSQLYRPEHVVFWWAEQRVVSSALLSPFYRLLIVQLSLLFVYMHIFYFDRAYQPTLLPALIISGYLSYFVQLHELHSFSRSWTELLKIGPYSLLFSIISSSFYVGYLLHTYFYFYWFSCVIYCISPHWYFCSAARQTIHSFCRSWTEPTCFLSVRWYCVFTHFSRIAPNDWLLWWFKH